MKKLLLVAMVMGCGARVTPDGDGAGNNNLVGDRPDGEVVDSGTPADTTPATSDAGTPAVEDTSISTTPSTPPVAPADIDAVEVNDLATRWNFRITAACRVTDAKGLDTTGDVKACKELFIAAVDPGIRPEPCGPYGGKGTVTLRTRDGRVFVRDLSADRCSVLIPTLATEKYAYSVWAGAGGK
jgi:hypothetical protein